MLAQDAAHFVQHHAGLFGVELVKANAITKVAFKHLGDLLTWPWSR
jgi:hypothetical protein